MASSRGAMGTHYSRGAMGTHYSRGAQRRAAEVEVFKKDSSKVALVAWHSLPSRFCPYLSLYESMAPLDLFFARNCQIYSTSIMAVQRTLEIIKITPRFIDHLAMITSTKASPRRAAVIAPPSPESGITCYSR